MTDTITRCLHRTATGRRCAAFATTPDGFCLRHLPLHHHDERDDFSRFLSLDSRGFQTAQGVNYSLTNLYVLLAAGKISPRRASVLAYISSLLLRSLPAI